MRDWDSAVLTGNMFGNIIVPAVPADRSIQIGGILGDEADSAYSGDLATAMCQCQLWNPTVCDACAVSDIINEESPRDPDYPRCSSTEDSRGQVWTLASDGLQGQLVVNAASTGLPQAALWTDAVQVGEDSNGCPLLEVSPAQSQPDLAPHYARLSAVLGGGAVGLVPFALHDEDCDPPADAAQASRTFLNSEFCHIPYARNLCEGSDPGEIYADASIYLQFYGPILAESATERPYEIGIEVNGQPDFSTDYGMWTQYETLPQLVGGAERRLRISGGEFTQLLAGHYYVRPKRTGSARLLCDGLRPGAAATAVANFTYEFWLVKDCNTNGVADEEEQTGFCCLNLCDPDFNQDGNADQDDVAYLTYVVAGGYNPTGRDPDFTGDGNADQDDIQALVNTIGGGGCP
ncbi:MAG: hypothetical protein IT433_13240 [Phycisphaerales bacterium]|nr:hypothetical protein [Phycisphaerales bacterium]